MKTTKLISVVVTAMLSVGVLAINAEAQQRGRRQGRQAGSPLRNAGPGGAGNLGQAQGGALTAAETSMLSSMLDEEKLAHDVYVTLAATSSSPIFTTIARAETQHMRALRRITDRYGLDVPVADNTVGQFTDPQVTQLFQTLVAQGSQSPLDAYHVGATIEEMDIADLNGAMAVTTHADVQRVFGNLQRGSRNHLRAFDNAIRTAGGTYTAKHLSQDEYNRIAAAPVERGNGAGVRSGGSQGAGRGGQGQSGGNGPNRGQGNGGRGPGNRRR